MSCLDISGLIPEFRKELLDSGLQLIGSGAQLVMIQQSHDVPGLVWTDAGDTLQTSKAKVVQSIGDLAKCRKTRSSKPIT